MQRNLAALAVLVVSVLPAAASAGVAPPSTAVVLELYEGARPLDAEAILKPVYGELSRRGHVGGEALRARVGTDVSREPGQLTASQGVEAQKAVDQGYEAFIDGD